MASGRLPAQNPDQALIRRFERDRLIPTLIDTSPLALALDGHIVDVDAPAGRIDLRFTPGPSFVQGMGVVQGGAVAAMLDFAMAFAGLAALPDELSCATANLNVSFLRAAPLTVYRATGTLERRSRNLIFARAALQSAEEDDGLIVATASSTLLVVA